MDRIQLRDEAVRDRIRAATEFLDPTDPRARSYRADIVLMLNRGLRRLVVSIDEIRAHNRELADGILYQPFDFSLCFDEADAEPEQEKERHRVGASADEGGDAHMKRMEGEYQAG